MNRENVQILIQLVSAMDEASKKLEEAFNKRDIEKFNNAKQAMLNFQQQISGMIE